MTREKLRLTDAMIKFEKEFEKGVLNILNAPPACGKTTYIFNEFLNNTTKYIKGVEENKMYNYCNRLGKILYLCDTSMLKDSVANENRDIAKVFGKGSIVEAKDFNSLKKLASEDNGTIKIMTYATFGWFIKNAKESILNNFNIIIADEIHNLFKYCKKHNTEMNVEGKKVLKEGVYSSAIKSLEEICNKTLFIGMTGTMNSIYEFQSQFGYFVKLKPIFRDNERSKLFTYNYEPTYVNCMFSRIKSFDWTSVIKEKGYKIFVYTNTIKQSEKYKKYFEAVGLKAEWICSTNREDKIEEHVDEETGEAIVEKVPTMRGYKKQIRDKLVEEGRVPDDLDVLIVNSAYETGWNLKDKRFQIAFIDTTDLEEQEQARYRLRHDIIALYCLYRQYNEEGIALERGQFGEIIPWEIYLGGSIYGYVRVHDYEMRDIDEKYLGIKLTTEIKEELKFIYGVRSLKDRKVTWKTLKRDLQAKGYIVKTNSRETYIFKQGQEIKKDSKKVVKKMSKLIEFLEKHDGKRLDKKGQDKLRNLINPTVDGEVLKTPSNINNYFSSVLKIDFVIIPKKSGNVRQWLIESIQN